MKVNKITHVINRSAAELRTVEKRQMSSLSDFVTGSRDATVEEPRNFEFMIAPQSYQSEELAHGMMENKGTRRVLKRSPFTRVQALTGSVHLPRANIHTERRNPEPLTPDFRDSGTDVTSAESDTAEFFDFDYILPPGMDYFGVPTPCIHNKCELAHSSTGSLLEKDSLTDFLLDQEQLSSETKTSLKDIPCILDKTEKDSIGRDAIKYWPSPSLPEAFHLSEAIIKFTRDVEAARNHEI